MTRTLTAEHLRELHRIAEEDADSDFGWCYDACELGRGYLRDLGVVVEQTSAFEGADEGYDWTGFAGCDHSWLQLFDGTIIDPTVGQFLGLEGADETIVDGWPHHPDVPEVAVVPLGHAFASNYCGR